ncbi:hypothetical protein EV174_002466 [Coemansia sp. RSA 2320]|nr:hypothetical protein EV174_002466 [Coemansia sp. RSA 2320]
MGMVSLNLELIWFMLHKGVLPRIVFYGHLASTVRCSAANIDVNTMVPPNIDESCYELALREIPHIKDCAAIWGAIGICMVARYEFQSARYTEMSIHADMAMDVVRRITFTGCSYPWHDVSAEAKESFGFQYLLAIFWKVFLWKLMAVMLVDRDLAFPHCLEVLPDYSSKSFDLYTADQSYSVDLIEMLPPNSWLGADVSRRPNIMFSGPNDPEFMRRPEGSPYFNRESMAGAYTQQMLVVFARFLAMLGHIKLGSIGLRQLLKGLWVFKERMNMLRYTLPPELMLVHGIMEEYLDIIKPASRASLREIDLKASRLKDVIMLHLMYHTFLIRANRLAMKLMLGESLDVPPPNVDTAAFAIRDLYDSKTPPQNVRDSLGHMNIYFQGCRIEAIKSANALCSIIQMAYECRFNFYTLGSPIIFTVFELLAVHSSFLRNRDRNIVWRAKSRLSNIFNICRTLRHWAPALNMFVAGIKLLSDPALCLEESSDSNSFQREDMDPVLLRMSASSVDSDATSDDENTAGLPPKRRRIDGLHHTIASTGDARANVLKPTATRAIPVPTTVVKRDETLSYKAADPIPEFPNPDKKRKCDGAQPVCSLCHAHGVPCEYRRSRRFRKHEESASSKDHDHAILPVPTSQSGPPQQHAPSAGYRTVAPLEAGPPNMVPPSMSGFQAATSTLPKSLSQAPNMFSTLANSVSSIGYQQSPFQSASASLPSEIDALSRLLTGDMYPQAQQLPQPIVQGVNAFMSPFSNARSQTMPEWVSQNKPEAAILANLEYLASAYQASPLNPLQNSSSPDSILFGNLTSQFMPDGAAFPQSLSQTDYQPAKHSSLGLPVNGTSTLGVSEAMVSTFAIPSMLTPVTATGLPTYDNASSSGSGGLAFNYTSLPSVSMAGVPDSSRRPLSVTSSTFDSASDKHSPAMAAPTASTRQPQSDSGLRPGCPPQLRHIHQVPETQAGVQYPADFVPEIIRIYAQEFPVELSPVVLLKVMRGIYSNTRTSLINVDIELSWIMILRGILPRVLLFSYIASMARGQVIDAELMPQLPDRFDEICYEYAVKDIPLVLASPSLWGALSLHMIGRYEFQSSRYDLMLEHYEMATDIMTKTAFHGYSFPWSGAPDELKRTFEYDYYVYTFWVGFQWHLVSCINLDREFKMDMSSLPIPTCTNGYFAPELPCDFDVMTMLPANSWPLLRQSENPTEVWFHGFNDPEYEGWRPAEWKSIAPNYKITVYLQRMLPLGARLYMLQRSLCKGKLSLANYLHHLNSQQELLKRWLYSLPEEFEITKDKVDRLTKAAAGQLASSDSGNMIMEFKELVMTFGLYHMVLVRANRVALLAMVNELTMTPATSMQMQIFGLRDYFEATDLGVANVDFGSDEYGAWQKNLAFHKCRMQCYESMNILCDVVQLSFMLRLNLFTYGTTYVVIAGEILNVLISQMGINDTKVKWKTKSRLGHVLCLLRSLQHWAPAIYFFVYGIQALADPSMVIDDDSILESRRHKSEQRNEVSTHSMSALLNPSIPSSSSRASPLASFIGTSSSADRHRLRTNNNPQENASTVPEIQNPFPPNHVISLILDDLDTSLATFLAPAYPVLLLKVFASDVY